MLTRYGNLSGEQPAHGQVIGGGEKTDIALVKIDTNQKLLYVTWGNSDDAKVGVWVVAVGNPFALRGSVTAGIISALGRDLNKGSYDDFLQIDAPGSPFPRISPST